MKRPLVCILALLVSSIPLFGAEEKEVNPIIAVYDLEGPISESGQGEDGLLGLSMDAARPLTMLDLSRSLEKAAADEAVKAVVLDADGAEMDFSQVQEIRTLLLALRAAGKDVWMYSEHLTNRTALLGSAANHRQPAGRLLQPDRAARRREDHRGHGQAHGAILTAKPRKVAPCRTAR